MLASSHEILGRIFGLDAREGSLLSSFQPSRLLLEF